ncbi:MAG: hypothetical protein U0T72_01870 [Chitinophagales bacterium]
MLQRITGGWSTIRVIYLLLGIAVIIQGVIEKQWFAIMFGAYFASMGLLNYGCAAGACYTPPVRSNKTTPQPPIEEVQFEELKTKNQ